MTKKDRKKIADVFYRGLGFCDCGSSRDCWNFLQHEIAKVLADDDPKFNRLTFNRACEGGDGKE